MEKNRIAFCTGCRLDDNAPEKAFDPPEEFLLLPYGQNPYTKGGADGSFEFTEADADLVLQDFAVRGRDLVIDYEHQSLGSGKAPAAGWIDRLFKTASGLAAHVKYWTDEAARYLKNGEYRYFSPTLYFSRSGKNVSAIHSVALTNHPAMHRIPALAADDSASAVENPPEESEITYQDQPLSENIKPMNEILAMMDLTADDAADEEKKLALLRSGVSRLAEMNRTLTGFLTAHGFADLADAEKKLASLIPAEEKLRLERELAALRAEKLVSLAFRDGKLSESERVWAEKFAAAQPEAFRDWCAAAPRKTPDNRGIEERVTHTQDRVWTQEEKEIFHLLGVNPANLETKE